MHPTTYGYSRQTLNYMLRANAAMLCHLAAAGFVFLFFIFLPPTAELSLKIITYMFISAGIGLLFYVHKNWLLGQMRQQRVVLTKDGIHRHDGKYVEKLDYRSIEKLTIVETPSGDIESLYLMSEHGGMMKLHGLDRMHTLFGLLEMQVNDLVLVQRKRQRFVRTPLWLLHLLFLSVALLFFFVYLQAGSMLLWVYPVFWVLLAIYAAWQRPFSSVYGFRFFKWEITGSLLLLGLSLWLLM